MVNYYYITYSIESKNLPTTTHSEVIRTDPVNYILDKQLESVKHKFHLLCSTPTTIKEYKKYCKYREIYIENIFK